jgi:SRSO17 transposase
MTEEQLLELKPELDRFLESYAPQFGRPENHGHARRFVQGLLKGGERRNAENIAQNMAGANVRDLQAFLSTGVWDDSQVLAQMRQDVLKVLAEDDAVCNVDETGFAKKGDKSVGVARQYSGTLGKVDNCQIGVFANYCSAKGHTLIDRRLYLPQEWTDDPQRCQQAGVPQGVVFRTKGELALEMVAAAGRAAAGQAIRARRGL